MDANVYRASIEGSWEALDSFQGWSDQLTYMGDTVLHVHLRTPRHALSKPTRTPWYRRMMFWKSVPQESSSIVEWEANVEFVRNVLDHDAHGGTQSLLWHENADGEIPLHLAAKFGHVQAVEEFLRRAQLVGPEEVRRMVSKINKWKDTALHVAARAGYGPIVKLLVEADPSCPQQPNDDNETPLYLAAESQSEASVVAILDVCDSSALDYGHKGPCGLTALHVLVQWNTTGILIKKILDKDESLVRLQDETGSTPLHWAAAGVKVKQLSILLSYDKNANESAAYIQDNEGQMPLHTAALNYSLGCIKELFSSRPDCMDVVDSKGQNVLHYAANWACIRKFEFFLTKFDEQHRLRELFNSRNLSGETPLHVVAANIPNMTCNCKFLRVHSFMKSQQQYLKSFNKDNITVTEIVESHDHIWEPSSPAYRFGLLKSIDHMPPLRKRMKNNGILKNARVKELLEKKLAYCNKGAKSELVVAALVATVSFTAGFTLPGGLYQEGDNIGMAVLANHFSFKYFVMTNTLALLLSSFALLFYFLSATSSRGLFVRICLLMTAKVFTFSSILTMILAFLSGLSTVLPKPLKSQVTYLFLPFTCLLISMAAWAFSYLDHLDNTCFIPKSKSDEKEP